jgi:hypothetical protein
MANNDESKPELKRRTRPNLGGRPRLEDIAYLTPEMEEIAWCMRHGFTDAEIADKRECSLERIDRLKQNPALVARVKNLYGNELDTIAQLRFRMWVSAAEMAIRLQASDLSPDKDLQEMLKRYDPYERLMILTDAEKKLQEGKKPALPGEHTVGSVAKRESIFKPVEVHPMEDSDGTTDDKIDE